MKPKHAKHGLLRPPKAATYLSCTVRQLYNLERDDPDFPTKIVLSPRHVGYRLKALDLYLEKKEATASGG